MYSTLESVKSIKSINFKADISISKRRYVIRTPNNSSMIVDYLLQISICRYT